MAAVRHLEFYTFAFFLSRSPCQHAVLLSHFSLKSDNRLMSNGQKSDFQDGGSRHLEFQKLQFWSRDCNRVQYLMQCTKFHQNGTIFH